LDNAFAAFAIVILPISQLPMYCDYIMLPAWNARGGERPGALLCDKPT